ncbi:hypothetical protein F5Y19DRAFT_419464 [Xylariaceae sp. FL1651]|nr:hypothetical protein F5Y19DRAFT_419464 [Xylariaceae sp. FL1651]
MVQIDTIIRANQQFSSQHRDDRIVGVFAGATSGIGARTLERMITMYRAPVFYVLGRSSARFAAQRKALELLNPDCTIVYIETDVSLISGVDRASEQIKHAEKKVDYLYTSMGGLPLAGAEYTAEGLETCFAISYYSRIRLLSNLLPLLRQSPRPRVLTVLNGGRETNINEEDIGLEKNWTLRGLVAHTTLFTSLMFDRIAAENQLTLIHNHPGLVESDNVRRIRPPPDMPFIRRLFLRTAKFIFSIIRYFTGMSPREAGERQTYHLTNDAYGPGSHRVSKLSEIVVDNDALATYKQRGWMDRVWEFTVSTWDKALANSRGRVQDTD